MVIHWPLDTTSWYDWSNNIPNVENNRYRPTKEAKKIMIRVIAFMLMVLKIKRLEYGPLVRLNNNSTIYKSPVFHLVDGTLDGHPAKFIAVREEEVDGVGEYLKIKIL